MTSELALEAERVIAPSANTQDKENFDVIVIGSGAAGLTTAIVANKLGLKTLVVEKSAYFGGTTALSGGAIWIPNNDLMHTIGLEDTNETAEEYLRDILGELYEPEMISAFLNNALKMLRFFEAHTVVHFRPVPLPDYRPSRARRRGRTLLTEEYDGTMLGDHLHTLRPPLKELVLFDGLQIEGADIHPMRKTFKSCKAFLHTARLMSRFVTQYIRYGRGTRLTNGNALVGRLLKSALNEDVTLWNSAVARSLIRRDGVVRDVQIERKGTLSVLSAKLGIVLASGGFGANAMMLGKFVPFSEHNSSFQPKENVGDGIEMGKSVGGTLNVSNPVNCIWTPTSLLKKDGKVIKYPHIFIDRSMPGAIAVDVSGKRFVNEGSSYQEFVDTMHANGLTTVHLIADHLFLRCYGMGLVRPFPFRIRPYIEAGYLIKGKTIVELAAKIGADPVTLEATVNNFNRYAKDGQDPEFGRGSDEYSRFRGDPEHRPNPALGQIEQPPFYALAMHPGSLSTVCGLNTNAHAQVLNGRGGIIEGLYAVGLDMNSIMRGFYPGGGSSIGSAMTFGYVAAHKIAGTRRVD
jgi:hypothetical protein